MMHFSIDSGYSRKNHTFICAKGEYMAIAMYDLDKFKRINDMYGHSAGDEALVAVSEAVRSRLCEDEILVRWGGEEFIVIMKQNERNCCIFIYIFYIGWHFWNLTPKIKNFKFLITDLFSNRQNPFHPAQFQDSVW